MERVGGRCWEMGRWRQRSKGKVELQEREKWEGKETEARRKMEKREMEKEEELKTHGNCSDAGEEQRNPSVSPRDMRREKEEDKEEERSSNSRLR